MRAKDGAGNVDPVGAFHSWKVDATKARVTASGPKAGSTPVPAGANVTAKFSEAMRKGTLTRSTVTLQRKGSATPVAGALRYPAANQAVLDPSAPLRAGATYVARITTGANLAGNSLDQSPATAGNQAMAWTFKVKR